MNHNVNTIEIKTLGGNSAHVPQNILSSIQSASQKSGVDFTYLVNQASAESSFNPNAEAKTSSASGLYQFINSTWLSMIDRYGDEYGLNTNGKTKDEILDMRKDPKSASFMAAAFASENEKFLNTNWGGKVGATELYFAHFLGAGGATAFLKARDDNPIQRAADVFPQAAQANRNVFYDRETGTARTLEEVYQFFDKKFDQNQNSAEIAIAQHEAPANTQNPSNTITTAQAMSTFIASRPDLDHPIMQKAYAMRQATDSTSPQNYGYNQITRTNKISARNDSVPTMPFFSKLAKPVDIMLLTQNITPTKVIRDNR